MEYLNKKQTCYIKMESNTIFSSTGESWTVPGRSGVLLNYLIRNKGEFCSYKSIADVIYDVETDMRKDVGHGASAVPNDMRELKRQLRDHTNEEELKISDDSKQVGKADLVFVNVKGPNRGYILYLPEQEQSDIHQQIAKYYWKQNNKIRLINSNEIELIKAFVYPKFAKNITINMADQETYDYLVEAPNGFGKSTFMNAILLSLNYDRECKDEATIAKLEDIRRTIGIKDAAMQFLPLLIEAKNISKVDLVKETESADIVKWLYDVALSGESGAIGLDNFSAIVEAYKKQRGMVLLVDGFDEVDDDIKEIITNKLKQCRNSNIKLTTIVASRPLLLREKDLDSFYKQYKVIGIEALNITKDNIELYVRKYMTNENLINAYVRRHLERYVGRHSEKYFEEYQEKNIATIVNDREDDIVTDMICNKYDEIIVDVVREIDEGCLKKLVATPYLLSKAIVYISAFGTKKYLIVAKVVEEMMGRFSTSDVSVDKDVKMLIYQEIAFSLATSEDSIANTYEGFSALIIGMINKIVRAGYGYEDSLFGTNEQFIENIYTRYSLFFTTNNSISFIAPKALIPYFTARYLGMIFYKEYQKKAIENENRGGTDADLYQHKWRIFSELEGISDRYITDVLSFLLVNMMYRNDNYWSWKYANYNEYHANTFFCAFIHYMKHICQNEQIIRNFQYIIAAICSDELFGKKDFSRKFYIETEMEIEDLVKLVEERSKKYD